ncbi:NAD(P)H-dependent glycerol-3-phosphate dehydrogenase [Leucobacter ruminantium]|uniref:Glycerol-3-phosphate dehydrogenase n=1 Tax=Leucobacter ruminantium TaxID=1289170 RepID=A0A939RXM7_9MICO|nr:2-dehydropantoate 2-reductase N-terminal domain-containing protein [Leucobacter ruminantium]MBO1806302.1 NAD(P)-binding domain-containing protein [Leucobacter ruminantium]
MGEITILGAGAMGSALATPLSRNGHRVRLWGTHLDDARLDALSSGAPHPGTGVRSPEGVSWFRDTELEAALDGTDAVIIAVSSPGVHDTAARAAARIGDIPIMLASKGFHRRADGTITLMPEAVREALGQPERRIVAIGGPCKADEVAAGRITSTLYASHDREEAVRAAALLATDDYRVEVSDDETGLEICAPLKNVYAIALGYADGLQQRTGQPWHNLKSALFARAVGEMSVLSELTGGRTETAFGLAGVGDLEVTGLSGRNKVFGSRLGTGETVPQARAAMDAAGLTVEGIAACGLGAEFADQAGASPNRVPLLHAIRRVLDDAGSDPHTEFSTALTP